MARAAVKAKAQQAKATSAASKQPARRAAGRRRHAGGGNPNQELFFTKLRKRAKYVYVLLAVLFAVTFAFLGVGSGTNGGLDQLFQGINIFGGGGSSVGKAQKYVDKHPQDPKGYRDLATAYEGKGDTGSAVAALQQYTTLKPKDAKAWNELAGLQMSQAQTYLQGYQAAYQNEQLAKPGDAFLPAGKLGQALGQNKAEEVWAQQFTSSVQTLQQRTLTAFTDAVSSFERVTKITPRDPNAWFQLGQAAQQAGQFSQAATAYKRYLKLNPGSTSKAQIQQLIKQLSAAGS